MKCNQCNKEIVSKNSKKFCNSSCAAIYNNKNRQYTPSLDKRTKDTKCKTCGIDLSVNIRADLSKCKCTINCNPISWSCMKIINIGIFIQFDFHIFS